VADTSAADRPLGALTISIGRPGLASGLVADTQRRPRRATPSSSPWPAVSSAGCHSGHGEMPRVCVREGAVPLACHGTRPAWCRFRGPSGALGLLGCGALAAAAEMKEEQQDGKKG